MLFVAWFDGCTRTFVMQIAPNCLERDLLVAATSTATTHIVLTIPMPPSLSHYLSLSPSALTKNLSRHFKQRIKLSPSTATPTWRILIQQAA